MDTEFAYTTPEPLTIDFSPPIEAAGGLLERIVLREPTGSEVQFAEQHLTAKNGNRATRLYQRALVSRVSGVPEAALDDVPLGSFTRAARYLQDFVEAGLPDPNDEEEPGPSLTISFDNPIDASGVTHSSLTVHEPNLGMMSKADSALGDLSPFRVRAFQQNLVTLASGGKTAMLVSKLPVSVLNRAATFVMGFSTAGRLTLTS